MSSPADDVTVLVAAFFEAPEAGPLLSRGDACALRHLGASNARPATGGHGRCQPDTAERLGRACG
jgi:hypothetical protein